MSQFDEMSPEERQALVGEFLSEGSGYLQILNEKLVSAENAIKQGIPFSDDNLHEMFRAAHNIKGMASFVGLAATTSLTHDMETLLSKIRSREIPFEANVIDVLFSVFDVLEIEFKNLRETGQEITDIKKAQDKINTILDKVEHSRVHLPSASEDEQETVNKKYLPKFIEDADQLITVFNDVLLAVESKKGSPSSINELFRTTHTLKGSAGLINARRIARVAHSMENILSYHREKKTAMADNTISLLFAGIDAIKDIVSLYKINREIPFDVKPICEMLDTVYYELSGAVSETSPKNAESKPAVPGVSDTEGLPLDVRQKCLQAMTGAAGLEAFHILGEIEPHVLIKGVKAMLAQERLRKRGQLIWTQPDPETINDNDSRKVEVAFVLATLANEKEIRSLLQIDGLRIISIERLDQKSLLADAASSGQPVPVSAEPEEDRAAQSKQQDTKGAKMEELTSNGNVADDKMAAGTKSGGIELSTIRIDSHKLDNLMNLTGELVIVRARFSQILSMFGKELALLKENAQAIGQIKSFNELLEKEVKTLSAKTGADKANSKRITMLHGEMDKKLNEVVSLLSKNDIATAIHSLDEMTSSLGKISSDIQTGVMQARMVPIEGIFTRFKRIVRDISKSLSKDVNLVIEGEETELDKKIVDSLGDPLTHMIRNAVDHGLEDSATRAKLGKNPTGTIVLSAAHKGNNIWIEVRDDGGGIDAGRLAKLAIKKGMITEPQAEKMSDKDKLNLIFLPGFSTAEKVTGLSGRGVGMDVVKNMVSSVNGTIDIETEIGKGTTFILKIPLTLAIIKALLVVIGEESYSFPLDSVTEIVKVSTKEIYSVDRNDTIRLRGHALSLVELPKILKIKGKDQNGATSKRVVVITDGNKKVGVVVDSLVGEEEIVIKSLPEHFSQVRGITGASILGDGKISLILDPISIIDRSR